MPDDYGLPSGESPSEFQRLLGYRIAEWRQDYAEIELRLEPRHGNRVGVAHGAVITALIDTACGLSAAWCPFPGRARHVLTLALSMTFVGQARSGIIRGIGRKKGGGKRIVFCAADVLDADGKLIAMGEGTFRYRSGSETLEGVPL